LPFACNQQSAIESSDRHLEVRAPAGCFSLIYMMKVPPATLTDIDIARRLIAKL